MLVADIQKLHGDYIRLRDRFKALWTFHQFLRGVHQTFQADAPPSDVRFNEIFEQMKEVASGLTSGTATPELQRRIAAIEAELDAASGALREADRRLSPSLVRRFFERARPQDDKIVLHLLRFFFSLPEIDDDVVDKIDFLATIAATAPGGDGSIPREMEDAVRLFEPIVSGCPWPRVSRTEESAAVTAFEDLSRDVAAASSFEELIAGRRVENVRTLKRRLGRAWASPRVLAAVATANVRTRGVFRRLFIEEDEAIASAAERLARIEQAADAEGSLAARAELTRVKSLLDHVRRQREAENVRAGDVLALKDAIAGILSRFDLGEVEPQEIEEALEIPEPHAPARETSDALQVALQKVLAAVEMGDSSLRPAERLGLEPWEIRAAKRAIDGEGRPASLRDALVLDAAAIRIRAEEQVALWRQALKMGRPLADQFEQARETLRLASQTDSRFAAFLHEASEGSSPEQMQSLLRTRFRLLQVYSALWLLHDDAQR